MVPILWIPALGHRNIARFNAIEVGGPIDGGTLRLVKLVHGGGCRAEGQELRGWSSRMNETRFNASKQLKDQLCNLTMISASRRMEIASRA